VPELLRGSLIVGTSETAEYLSRLMNRSVAPETVVVLTSAQRARFLGWLSQKGVRVDSEKLRGHFSVRDILGNTAESPRKSVEETVRSAGDASIRTPPADGGLSIGIDIQHIDELFRSANLNDFKADHELTEIFTMRELSYAQSSQTPKETLAGIFAAKEAVRKCMGGRNLSRDEFRSIEVLPDEHGRPRSRDFEISISHSGGFAVAVSCARTPRAPGGPRPNGGPLRGGEGIPPETASARSQDRRYKRLLWGAGVLIMLQGVALVVALLSR